MCVNLGHVADGGLVVGPTGDWAWRSPLIALAVGQPEFGPDAEAQRMRARYESLAAFPFSDAALGPVVVFDHHAAVLVTDLVRGRGIAQAAVLDPGRRRRSRRCRIRR